MKKRILVLLFVVLALGLASCSKPAVDQTDKVLRVGSAAGLTGDWDPGFTSATYDNWALRLIYGYSTIVIDPDKADYIVDETVVKNLEEVTNDDGSKTFTFTIADNLVWSDGTPITAKDYVFDVLWRAHPEWLEIAPEESAYYALKGFDDYSDGLTNTFDGVKYIDDTNFSVTVSSDYVPYFFEKTLMGVSPMAYPAFFADASLNEDGNGFANSNDDIRAAANKFNETERKHPTLFSGPYVLDSFENSIAVLKINDKYVGDFNGKKGKIGTVTISTVAADVVMDSLIKGEIHVTEEQISGNAITEGLAAVESGKLKEVHYNRAGYGTVVFQFRAGTPTEVKEVRQAIAYLTDRTSLIQSLAKGYGSVVQGPYGKSLWFYNEAADEIDAAVIDYTLNVDKANELLDMTDYKFEKDGVTPFDVSKAGAGTNYFRHNSAGKKLAINHAGASQDVVDELTQTVALEAPKAGMDYQITYLDWTTFVTNLQLSNDKIGANPYTAFSMGFGFYPAYDPYYSFHKQFANGTFGTNYSDISDDVLSKAIDDMRYRDGSDREGFIKAFTDYVVRWNELLPQLPLYSNVYYNFASADLKGMENVGPFSDWSYFITSLEFTK